MIELQNIFWHWKILFLSAQSIKEGKLSIALRGQKVKLTSFLVLPYPRLPFADSESRSGERSVGDRD